MDQLLCQLNQAQLEAVTSTEGFIRVIAGAGSGKTRALSHRFAFLFIITLSIPHFGLKIQEYLQMMYYLILQVHLLDEVQYIEGKIRQM